MKIFTIISNLIYSNMYVIEENNHLILIDPCIIDISLKNKTIDYIFLTHEHYDHISGVNYWKEKCEAKVICSKSCAENIKSSRKNLSIFFKTFCELQIWVKLKVPVENVKYVCQADKFFDNSLTIEWQGNKIYLFGCPGHSLGSSCVLVNDKILFSGDSLFKDYPTVTGLPGGSKKGWLEKSLPFLKSLPKDTIVYPGHFNSFCIKDYYLWE